MATRRTSAQRQPFAASVPRAQRRVAGITSAGATPLAIRLSGTSLDAEQRSYIRSRLGTKLSKFATSIERTTVRLRDDNGPRGGVDIACTIKVVLRRLESVVYEAVGAEVREAFDIAAGGIVRAVKRALGKAGSAAPRGRAAARERGGEAPARARAKGERAADQTDAQARRAPRAAGKSATQLTRRQVREARSPKTRATKAVVRRKANGS